MLGWLKKKKEKKKDPFKLGKSLFPWVVWWELCCKNKTRQRSMKVQSSHFPFHLKLYITGVYKQKASSITDWVWVFVLLSTPGLVSALHLPDCFHSKLLPTCHLHVGHILFKCLRLSRGAFQNRHPADLELCTDLDEVWADAKIIIIKLMPLQVNFH